MFFLVATLIGLISFNSMKIQNFPDVTLPAIVITVGMLGAAPEQLETEVAKKIENVIAPLDSLKHITTTLQDGSVLLFVEFRLEKPIQEALDEVKSAVATVRFQLPSDIQEPIINKVNFSSTPILTYTIDSNKMDDEQLSWFVDNDLAKKLLSIKGIGSIERVGGVNREVQILIDPVKIKALGITASDISRQLKQIQTESSGGRMDIGNSEQPIRAIATIKSASELNSLELRTASGVKVKLGDIASINDTFSEKRTGAYFNGKTVIGFEISRSKGASEVDIAKDVLIALEQIKQNNPDIEIQESFNFVKPIEESYYSSMNLLYEGALLATLVVWLFLRDIRATFVSAVALPLSIIPAFIFMYFFGFSINIITLLAMSLVVGILVDDAIVEVENIERHMDMGKNAYDAAMEATQEIGLAVIATTFTLIAVFLPTAFMSGVAGLFFKQFGWTAALAVFASLIVARLLTPMMAAYIMKRKEKKIHKEPIWMKSYLTIVKWCINNRFKTAFFAGVFFISSISMIPFLPKGFMPADNTAQTQVSLELEPGSIFEQTLKATEQARELIKKIPEVTTIYTTIGAGNSGAQPGATNSEVRTATLTIQLKPKNERPLKKVTENKIRDLLVQIPGIRFKVGRGASGEKYIISLSGEDGNSLLAAANAIELDLRTIPNIGSISSGASLNRTEIAIKIDYSKAADLGVTTNSIADTLRIATSGDYNNSLSKMNSSARQIPIVVILDNSIKKDINYLKNIQIPGKNSMVTLSSIADVEFVSGPAIIKRFDRSRNISIEIELSGIELGDMTTAVENLPSVKKLPAGVTIVPVGDSEMMQELFANFGLAMLTGIVFIYIILVLLFKDFLQPITILTALPLSLGGAFVALLSTGQSFSMPSLIGLIMLMGVATKNSILLVEYAIIARRNGMDRFNALVDACHKRARPIIMTTLAMGAGMLPIALQWGSGDGTFKAPMAIAVIGGLITSTFLSLLVIPAIFTYVDDLNNLIKKITKIKNN